MIEKNDEIKEEEIFDAEVSDTEAKEAQPEENTDPSVLGESSIIRVQGAFDTCRAAINTLTYNEALYTVGELLRILSAAGNHDIFTTASLIGLNAHITTPVPVEVTAKLNEEYQVEAVYSYKDKAIAVVSLETGFDAYYNVPDLSYIGGNGELPDGVIDGIFEIIKDFIAMIDAGAAEYDAEALEKKMNPNDTDEVVDEECDVVEDSESTEVDESIPEENPGK